MRAIEGAHPSADEGAAAQVLLGPHPDLARGIHGDVPDQVGPQPIVHGVGLPCKTVEDAHPAPLGADPGSAVRAKGDGRDLVAGEPGLSGGVGGPLVQTNVVLAHPAARAAAEPAA